MTVSILVPIYGVEKFIAHCAESLFRQTYANLEYIFVNDCTPDGSINVLRGVMERFPERARQVRIIEHSRNRGLGAARLAALEAATGDCVMHVDSDDYIPESAVEVLCHQMQLTGADVVDGGYATVCRGEIVNQRQLPPLTDRQYIKLLLCQNIVSNRIWGRLYRRSLYTAHGIAPIEGIDYSEDYAIVPRLMLHARRAVVNEVVYYYRNDNMASYTHQFSEKNFRSFLRANRVVADFFRAEDKEGTYAMALQLGLLNTWRNARREGFSHAMVDEECPYRPKGWACRLCGRLLRSPLPYAVGNGFYLLLRRIYATFTVSRFSLR